MLYTGKSDGFFQTRKYFQNSSLKMTIDENNILTAKICGMALFSIISVIIGLLPMFIHARFKRKLPESEMPLGNDRKYKNIISCLSAFGGGVLLSTAFLHLLPEIRGSIENLRLKGVIPDTRSLPLAELLMCLGFLFLYLIEEIVHKVSEKICHKHVKNDHEVKFNSKVYINCSTEVSVNLPIKDVSTSSGYCDETEPSKTNGDRIFLPEDCENDKAETGDKSGIHQQFLSNSPVCSDTLVCNHDSTIFFTEGSGKNFLLIFALSIHEGFEGLAIGLQSQPEVIWYMILGVGAHKAIVAFCIGIQMLTSKLNRKVAIIYIFIFGTATSFGVAIGLFLYTGSGIFSIILQGLATGTLLHVVFFELLNQSEHSPFSGVFIGFICMAVLKYLSP